MEKQSQVKYEPTKIEPKWPLGTSAKLGARGKQEYNPTVIGHKWQNLWKKLKVFKAHDFSKKDKLYILVEFPYPSGDLHMGHWYAFVPPDVFARFQRMRGYNVLFPVGYDAFGLPAENAAIQRGIHPRDWTYGNIKRMTQQFESMGSSFDWERMIISSDPEYYRWTQWMFLKMYEAGLAYRAEVSANWCPECQTVLANEQVESGKCWRHTDTEVVQKKIPQWLFRVTDYAEKLLWSPKPKVDWPPSVIEGQNNWIGRSEGTEIKFEIRNSKFEIRVFTTRPDTLFGATFLVLAPEHELVSRLITPKHDKDTKRYINASKKRTELERKEMKKKTGVFTGSYAINPINNERIPIWIADYVLASYGTGSIMAVPAHDQRDFGFAKKYDLPIRQVIVPVPASRFQPLTSAYEGEGILINSGEFTGLSSEEARKKLSKYLEAHHLGEEKVQYHLHDWTISRQRYWGAPIPMIYCPKCARLDPAGQGIVPVPEKDLPVLLPYKVDYTPRGKAPLATAPEFVNTKCPKCGGKAKRDTDTMDTFVDSSWYFFRYVSPHFGEMFADPKKVKYWMPIDLYFGGGEHTLGHALYARFFTKVLYDLGYVPFDEFAKRRVHHGVILGPDGYRMSKSRGNVVNPSEEVKKYGADTVRMYLCFMGPHEAGGPWDPSGIMGVHRFLKRVWEMVFKNQKSKIKNQKSDEAKRMTHKAIKKVTEDLEALKFNTAIASLMEWLNYISKIKNEISKMEMETFLKLLAPFAPHMAEELWQQFLRNSKFEIRNSKFSPIHLQPWPTYNPKLIQEEEITIPVQINGKLRDVIKIKNQKSKIKQEVEKMARSARVEKYLIGKKIKKVIFVAGKLINFVTE